MTPDQSRYALVLEIPRRLVAPSLKYLILEQGLALEKVKIFANPDAMRIVRLLIT